MRKLIAITQVTLDGVMQAPGSPEEDPSNGLVHGGWAMPFLDDGLNQAIGETIAGEFDMLLGCRTYEIFAAYWPNQGDNPIAKAFNNATKHVVTRSLERFDWQKSQRIDDDIGRAGVAYLGAAANCCRRWSPPNSLTNIASGISTGTRRRKAAVRERRAAAWPHPGRDAKHA